MKKTLLMIALATLISGCAHNRPVIRVEALADPTSPSMRRFAIYPGNQGANSSDLEFRTFAGQVASTMEQQGYTLAGSPEQADLFVFLQYATTGPHTSTTTTPVPLWGQTGYSSSNTYGSVTSGGYFSSTTNYTPTYGITGYMPVTSSQTYYVHAVRLAAFSAKVQEMWNVSATAISGESSVRNSFWAFMQAMGPYIGRTQGPTDIPIVLQKK